MKILIVAQDIPATSGWGRYSEILVTALRKAGHEARTTPELGCFLGEPLSYGRLLLRLSRLQRCIDTFQPDVIHIIVEPYAILVPFLRTRNVPILLTIHGSYCYPPVLARSFMRPLYRFLFQKAFDRLGSVVAISSYTRNLFLSYLHQAHVSFDQNKLDIISNSIDITKYEYSSHSVHTPPVILTVAPIKSRKGIKESIEGLAVLASRGIDFRYRIVGTYDMNDRYVQNVSHLIEHYNLESRVTLLGRLDEKDLQREYVNADVFLMLPLQSDKVEGFGLVYLEANACGTPTIGSRDSGAQDAINDGHSGLLVNSNDPQKIAESIEKVIHGDIERKDARAWAEAHNSEAFGTSFISLYKEIQEMYLSDLKIHS